jgi:hypothetical protein
LQEQEILPKEVFERDEKEILSEEEYVQHLKKDGLPLEHV